MIRLEWSGTERDCCCTLLMTGIFPSHCQPCECPATVFARLVKQGLVGRFSKEKADACQASMVTCPPGFQIHEQLVMATSSSPHFAYQVAVDKNQPCQRLTVTSGIVAHGIPFLSRWMGGDREMHRCFREVGEHE